MGTPRNKWIYFWSQHLNWFRMWHRNMCLGIWGTLSGTETVENSELGISTETNTYSNWNPTTSNWYALVDPMDYSSMGGITYRLSNWTLTQTVRDANQIDVMTIGRQMPYALVTQPPHICWSSMNSCRKGVSGRNQPTLVCCVKGVWVRFRASHATSDIVTNTLEKPVRSATGAHICARARLLFTRKSGRTKTVKQSNHWQTTNCKISAANHPHPHSYKFHRWQNCQLSWPHRIHNQLTIKNCHFTSRNYRLVSQNRRPTSQSHHHYGVTSSSHRQACSDAQFDTFPMRREPHLDAKQMVFWWYTRSWAWWLGALILLIQPSDTKHKAPMQNSLSLHCTTLVTRYALGGL